MNPALDHDKREIVITPLPLYHIFSLTANCLVFMSIGGENILIPNPRDIPGFVKEIGKYKFTAITGVNTLFNALLNNPDFAKLDFSHLHITLGGGMAVQEAVAKRWKAGHRQAADRGLRAHRDLAGRDDQPVRHQGVQRRRSGCRSRRPRSSCATTRASPWRSARRARSASAGPQVMAGYWNRPDETAKVMDKDGWFATGDIGVMDEKGFVRIVDRKKDMILVSGFNVYPNEIEGVVAMHARACWSARRSGCRTRSPARR